ncbi:MAG: hypothetical protein PHG67_09885 [Bacteroidales bacterium]|jgi:hypothetical protein|nr:hypothetical protein [Bacteroidales bacterium]
MSITIHQSLIDAGTKYRKELLTMPVAVLSEVLQYMTLKTGMQGKEVGGMLLTDAQLRPYRTAKDVVDNTKIEPYEWENFLGDVVKEFDPNAILGTLYTERTAKKPTEREIARLVALEMAKKVGEALYDAMFTAERNASGETTADLFNGFDTLAAAAVTAEKLKASLGNYADLSSEAITGANVGDVLKETWRGLNPLLKKQKLNLYMPTSILEMYEDWFQVEHGYAPFNNEFKQRTLIGSHGKCTFVPLDNMEGTDYMYFTVRQNMKVGVDQESDKETVRIRECDNPKLVQFFMMAYFGVGFDNLDKRFMKVVKYTTEAETPAE